MLSLERVYRQVFEQKSLGAWANKFRERDFKGKPNFDTLGFPLMCFFVGALRKHAGGMFLASDRSGYAARGELVEGLYLPNFLPFFPQGKKVTPPLHLQIRFAEIRRHVRAGVGIRPCGAKDENFLSQTRLPYEGSCQPQG